MFIINLSKQIAETMQLAVLVLLAVLLPLMHIASIHSITLCKRVHFWCCCGWSGGAKVPCILCHRGVQLILAYSWARPAILVVGKGRGGNVFISSVSSLSFLFLFLPCSSLSSLRLSLLTLFSLSQGDDTKWPTKVDVSLNPNTINQNLMLLHLHDISTLCSLQKA